MPSGPVALDELVPVLHGLAELMATLGAERAQAAGQAISCRKGCGACCRQPVPITDSEALWLARRVRELPEPRRSELRGRFDAALSQLDAAGVLAPLRSPAELEGPEVSRLGRAYFEVGVPCPFLEDESCSIHAERPLACREFLVTSAPEHCAAPSDERVVRVPLPAHAFRALRSLDARTRASAGWTTLVLALEHAGKASPIEQQSLAWLRDVLTELGTPKQPAREGGPG